MTRRHISAKERLSIFTAAQGVCHICAGKIDAGREAWEVEHVLPLNMGGDDFGANLQPAHVACHRRKSKADAANDAKAKRQRQREAGIRRQSRAGFRGWRTFSGEAKWRD